MTEIGIKHDGADGKSPTKDRWDLLPLGTIREIVKVLGYGSRKYKDWNWIHVEDAKERYYSALLRHLVAWRTGESHDPESNLHHLAHVLCNGVFLLWFELGGDELHKGIGSPPTSTSDGSTRRPVPPTGEVPSIP
jgi:hypothetical protein